MQARIQLPPGTLIEYHSFCKAIAQAAYPVRDQEPEGIECIVGKVVKHQIPMAQPAINQSWPSQAGFEPALLSQDGLTLDQLLVSEQHGTREHVALELPFADATHPAVVEFSLPYQLDDRDRRALEVVLPQLPLLRYPMTEDDAIAFMDAYFRLPNHPAWEPVLMTAAYVEQQRGLRERHFDKVLQALREEFAAGRLVACTQSGLPVKAMTLRCYIPRQSAIDYLDRHGLLHSDMTAEDEPGVVLPKDSSEPQGTDKCELTDKQRKELVAYRKALEIAVPKVKAPTKQTAEEFNVSESYVRRLLREDKAQSTTSIFPVTKRK
ncbi:hypothetical protein [Ralstonia pickettii]|uniref:hypothetical protein n=1 Tax=Ralstonia pickettii TaxID=329 RepID=UPI0015FBD8DC|nr:hypothetical protein [Ralstonia pickettii]MBB0025887.1 hypothetical protein [Ralstonia pickettii]MBB0036754.1 hypothetical protein [Ralstonia pickettii]MBB0099215.1 hypothetical protein [Ralstonia pickettii]MBB0109089.1 hypothetical protein [Ralstonia pickettii]MBB0130068.1 hypothetical protein [Ralstonia pickettii]